jgi:hypothetical protein
MPHLRESSGTDLPQLVGVDALVLASKRSIHSLGPSVIPPFVRGGRKGRRGSMRRGSFGAAGDAATILGPPRNDSGAGSLSIPRRWLV